MTVSTYSFSTDVLLQRSHILLFVTCHILSETMLVHTHFSQCCFPLNFETFENIFGTDLMCVLCFLF